jgi:hypothetical protein
MRWYAGRWSQRAEGIRRRRRLRQNLRRHSQESCLCRKCCICLWSNERRQRGGIPNGANSIEVTPAQMKAETWMKRRVVRIPGRLVDGSHWSRTFTEPRRPSVSTALLSTTKARPAEPQLQPGSLSDTAKPARMTGIRYSPVVIFETCQGNSTDQFRTGVPSIKVRMPAGPNGDGCH